MGSAKKKIRTTVRMFAAMASTLSATANRATSPTPPVGPSVVVHHLTESNPGRHVARRTGGAPWRRWRPRTAAPPLMGQEMSALPPSHVLRAAAEERTKNLRRVEHRDRAALSRRNMAFRAQRFVRDERAKKRITIAPKAAAFMDKASRVWTCPAGTSREAAEGMAFMQGHALSALSAGQWSASASWLKEFSNWYLRERTSMGVLADAPLLPLHLGLVNAFFGLLLAGRLRMTTSNRAEFRKASTNTVKDALLALKRLYTVNARSVPPDLARLAASITSIAGKHAGGPADQAMALDPTQAEMTMAKWGHAQSSYQRAVALYLAIGISCGLRSIEMSFLIADAIEFLDDGNARLFVATSKTDQTWNGCWVLLLARKGVEDRPELCPVRLLSAFVRDFFSHITPGSPPQYLFCREVCLRCPRRARHTSALVTTNTRLASWWWTAALRDALQHCCGISDKLRLNLYKSHSLRRATNDWIQRTRMGGFICRSHLRWSSQASEVRYGNPDLSADLLDGRGPFEALARSAGELAAWPVRLRPEPQLPPSARGRD